MSERKERQSGEASFADLGSYEAINPQTCTQTGNIIKGSKLVLTGVRTIEVHEGDDDHPSLIIHRESGRVNRVEFICTCGRGTTAILDYDGE